MSPKESDNSDAEDQQLTLTTEDQENDNKSQHCVYCGFEPCLWVQYSEGLRFDAEFFASSHGYDGDSSHNNLVRKHLYKKFTSMHLGIGNPRTPIPDCVLKKIRFYFPDPLHNYMGFKANYNEDQKEVK
jgi:hypothetical protein